MRGIDLTGQVFGSLEVISVFDTIPHRGKRWLCRCSCGEERVVLGAELTRKRAERTRSCKKCGLSRQIEAVTTHGHSANGRCSSLYHSWSAMRSRCLDVNCKDYPHYGGRGIIIAAEWESFEGFLMDMEDTWQEGLSIDRMDVNGNYCKENCRWATIQEQNRNKRNTIRLEHKGLVLSLKEWAECTGISADTLEKRFRISKWSVEDVLTRPLRKKIYC